MRAEDRKFGDTVLITGTPVILQAGFQEPSTSAVRTLLPGYSSPHPHHNITHSTVGQPNQVC